MEIKPIRGVKSFKVSVPASKSITNRALLIATLSDGVCKINNPLISDDSIVMIEALKSLGINIEQKGSDYLIYGRNGRLNPPKKDLYLKNAGTAVRFLCAAANLVDGKVILTGNTRMLERPIGDLLNALRENGCRIECVNKEGYLPLGINGKGALKGGKIRISGKISSQYISAILLIAPYSKNEVILEIKDELVSKPYIDLTLQIMKDFGVDVENRNYKEFIVPKSTYKAGEYTIEADASSAGYFYGIAALNGIKATVDNANPDSLQGDTSILDVLEKMGCKIEKTGTGISVYGPKELKPLGKINLNHMPDAAMTVAVIAACAEGISEITDIENLRVKETDRIKALVTELKKVRVDARETKTGLIINGNPNALHGAEIETYDDHRMAMCFGVLGTKVANMEILDPDCVNKTYPGFWRDLSRCYSDCHFDR